MGKVRISAYRQPPTASGLKKIEDGSLEWFETEVFSNLNTEVLEEYLDEKNRTTGFDRSKFIWWKVSLGIFIGVMFAMINQYVGLKIGLITGGAWYVSYLTGLALKWSPTEVNIASGAATGADRTCTGFVFTYPAIYLLAYAAQDNPVTSNYLIEGGGTLISKGDIPPLFVAIFAAVIAAYMGIMYFIIFRRIWLVEDPLPMPGFQAAVKLVDIANDISRGAADQAKRSVKIVTMVAGSMMAFTFLRDFPIYDDKSISFLDKHFHGEHYHRGEVMISHENSVSQYTHLGYEFTGIQLAIGWFMKFRTAILVSLGTLFTWFVVIPMAVKLGVPAYVPLIPGTDLSGYLTPTEWGDFVGSAAAAPWFAYGRIARVIAIGAILGGGLTSLAKMAPTFATATEDVRGIIKGGKGQRKDYVPGKGYYEWPVSHIPLMMAIAVIGITTIFSAGGFPVAQSLIFSICLVAVTFILGAIAIKVAGEVGITPVSGTSFITLLLLVGVFKLMGTDTTTTAIMALFGTTIFGTAISLSSDITYDFKVGLYCGTRPYHLMKGEITGITFGAIMAATMATIFSRGLAEGELALAAPQAHAFATFTQIVMGGKVQLELLGFGFMIGMFVEILTGMGTAFGLGMYLLIPITLPFLVGGAARDLWEKHFLEPKAKAEGWTEREKTMKLLETYMVATGLLVGEAVLGAFIAIYMLT